MSFLLHRILKLYEVGIMQLLKHRWIETKNAEETASNKTEPIIMEEVYLILLILGCGVLTSFAILVFEILIFYYSN